MATDDITQILNALDPTDCDAAGTLVPAVYEELRSLADAYLRNERSNHTLQATALVHEAFVHLSKVDQPHWENRGHYFRVAAKTMRRILINHAHSKRAEKRGGGRQAVSLTAGLASVAAVEPVDVLQLDEALTRLDDLGGNKARVVELRYFAGCTIDETAEALDVSTATVERDWRFARAWLRSELSVN